MIVMQRQELSQLYTLLHAPGSGIQKRFGDRRIVAVDRLIPLLGVITVHISMIAWLTLGVAPSEPRLAAQESLMTGLLLAPPVPQPVIEPPKPLPLKKPVVQREPEPLPPPLPEPPPVERPVAPMETPGEHALTEVVPPPSAAPLQANDGKLEPQPQVTPPRIDASQLDNPAPAYPSLSRRLREQGRVLLDVYILADGSVGEIRLKVSSGHERLDRSALEAVRNWHYVPARRGGEPIPYWYVQPVVFSLTH